jgi:transposase
MEAAPPTSSPTPPPPAPLPGDVAACHEMLRRQQALIDVQRQTLEEMGREKQAMLHRMAQLLRRLYGRSSEQVDAAQLKLFGEAMEAAGAAHAGEAAAEATGAANAPESSESPARRRGKPHGRQPLPCHLPRYRLVHPVDPNDLTCPCGCTRRLIGEVVTEQLEYAPANLFILQHVQLKHACSDPACTHSPAVVIVDKPPQPIEKGLPGPGLIAYVLTSKYADHQPLYRLEGILARQGVNLDRSTMGGWVEAAADLLLPLYQFMVSLLLGSRIIKTDDTTVPVLDKAKGQTRTGRLWGYIGDDPHPVTVFDYSPDHRNQWPVQFLAGYEGYLQADAYNGYDAVFAAGKVIEVGCMAHCRRKFHDAKESEPVAAHQALAFIRQLYAVEAKAKGLGDAARLAMRKAESDPVLEKLHEWLLEQQKQALPKSPIGQAIGYALNQWQALCRYTKDGGLEIDNNEVERLMKLVALGRKNYLFAGSDEGGKRAAVHYSFVATCKRHGVDPQAWFTDVLARIPSTPLSQLEQFLPHRWKQEKAAKAAEAKAKAEAEAKAAGEAKAGSAGRPTADKRIPLPAPAG